jgi:subtilisin family serine protease
MLQALAWLKKRGVAVANLSFAGPPDDLLHRAVQELTKAGIVVVAAAGNEGPSAPPSYPAAYEEVIAVTAVDRHLAAYRYASRGDHIDLAAPGVDVWTALPGRREGPQTGTSFAVPFVTAVVAVAGGATGQPADDDPLAAKARALAAIAKGVRSLGQRDRNPTFGAGLVQAPAPCEAIAPRLVAAAEAWTGTVRRELEPAAAGPGGFGAWVSTVHTAAGGGGSH